MDIFVECLFSARSCIRCKFVLLNSGSGSLLHCLFCIIYNDDDFRVWTVDGRSVLVPLINAIGNG